ncbi:MAG: pinensin family lanthipeptide [Acidobacteriota bacterium]|nr:pinensin family lanthipeptide [Acidobacteriota bacterium]
MQKKMNLDQLKIRSFVTTQEKEVKGGTGRVCMPPTYFWYLCTDGLCA